MGRALDPEYACMSAVLDTYPYAFAHHTFCATAYETVAAHCHQLVAGWSDLRLLAPRAELRLLLCGGSSLIDSHKLSFLGEALRALLIMETRNVTVSARGHGQRISRLLFGWAAEQSGCY